MKEKTNRLYQFSDYKVEVDEGLLKKGETKIPLTRKAFEILVVLLKNHGRVVDKETLLNEVWADTYVEETTLAQNIFTIRKTLGAGGSTYIETVPRRGYKFVADVTELPNGEEAVILQRHIPPEIAAERETDADQKLNLQTKNEVRSFFAGDYRQTLTAAVLLLAAVSLFFLYGFISYYEKQTSARTDAPFIESIAVLPFQIIGDENRNEKLGFGMADAIITRLSKLQKIPVRPTTAVFPFTEKPASNPLETGRDLGVDAIVEGTIQRDGERVRISVRLLSVADGKPLWAETFDEKCSDIFVLQDSISTQVVRSLALKLTPEQEKLLEQRATSNPQAFESYQIGVYLWSTRTRENLQKAEAYFQKAVELDPKFGRAYGMLADTYHMIAYYGSSNNVESYEKARLNALKALALDDSVAEAYLAMAGFQLYAKDINAARLSLEEAVKRAPYNSTVRVRYAWILLRLGKIDQAVQEMRLAEENDPLSPVTTGALCNMLIYREDYAEAVEVCQKAVDISADTANNRLSLAYALFFNGNNEEAIKQVSIVSERSEQKNSALGALGYFYAKLERRAEAEDVMRQLKSSAETDFELYQDLALISYALGSRDEAFEYFKTLYEKRLLALLYFRNDPVWKDIRQDSRFAELVREFP